MTTLAISAGNFESITKTKKIPKLQKSEEILEI